MHQRLDTSRCDSVFALPDQDLLKLGQYIYLKSSKEIAGKGMEVYDGYSCAVEFKVGEFYRRYTFSNPESHLELYFYSSEFRNYVAIMDAFEKLGGK